MSTELRSDELRIEQQLTLWDALNVALRRWPYLWASRQWGYAPSWWIRLLAVPPLVFAILRNRRRFPLHQNLRFDARGVTVHLANGARHFAWADFTGWIDLEIGWMLLAPGFDLVVLRRGLARPEVERLHALLGAQLQLQAPPRR